MKKSSISFLSLAAFIWVAMTSGSLFAQSFTVSPSNTVSAQIPSNGYGDLQIDLTNTSGSAIVFEWESVSNSFNPNWSTVMCDYQSCYPSIPASGTMYSLNDGEMAFIKLTVGVGAFSGPGTAVFRVWPQGDSAAFETLTFNVDALVGVDQPNAASSVDIYPNPASNVLFVRNNGTETENGTLEIFDVSGATILKRVVPPGESVQIDLSAYAEGVYFLRFQQASTLITKKILKVD